MRVGFTVTKKIGGAVVRNRMKRRFRALAREIVPAKGVAGADHVLIGRAKGISYDREIVAIGTVLHDIGLTAAITGPYRFEVNGAQAVRSFIAERGITDRRAQLLWDLVALNSTPSLALHKEPEVAVGTMGIGLDYGGFFIDTLAPGDVDRVVSAFPRLKMKDQFTRACCQMVIARPETSSDNFLRDFGERFVAGYKPVSTVDLLLNAPFAE